MKVIIITLFNLLFFSYLAHAESPGVMGKVSSSNKLCSNKVMVWLSLDKENYNERLLLMHTEVPVDGSFQFYMKPGYYQLRATDEKGCEFFKKIRIDKSVIRIAVQMVKK